MKLVQKFPFLGSSVDPQALSLTVKGVLGALATLLVAFGVIPVASEVSPIIEVVGDLVVKISGVVSGLVVLVGMVRKILNRAK